LVCSRVVQHVLSGAIILALCVGWAGLDRAEAEEAASRPRVGIAFAEAQATNLFFNAVDRFVLGYDWAQIDFDSISRNFASGWVWDQDEFFVNQIAHPYHGSLYFNAGRSNGLGFYPSALLASSGSTVWELCMETEPPSLNDLISTTTGGAALGEMLHRLYVAAARRSSLAACAISPMDGVNRGVFGAGLTGEGADYPDISSSECSLSAGLVDYSVALDEQRGGETERRSVVGDVGARLVYGEPFGRSSSVPYESFEQRLGLSFSPEYWLFSFFSDGFLRSWALREAPNLRTSLGISLHYDFIYSADVTFSAHSLGFSMKRERFFPRGFRLRTKVHASWVMLGASEYSFFAEGDPDRVLREYDLGSGEGLKLELNLAQRRMGEIAIDYAVYGLHTIPSSEPNDAFEGYTIIGMLSLAYEHAIRPRLSLGISSSLYHKESFYEEVGDLADSSVAINLYVKRRF